MEIAGAAGLSVAEANLGRMLIDRSSNSTKGSSKTRDSTLGR